MRILVLLGLLLVIALPSAAAKHSSPGPWLIQFSGTLNTTIHTQTTLPFNVVVSNLTMMPDNADFITIIVNHLTFAGLSHDGCCDFELIASIPVMPEYHISVIPPGNGSFVLYAWVGSS